ncbi:MAG TPA: hypothetical protein EYQ23_04310 [Verrucomicrobiales bacterium]|nr:hypothetical protein [Verrucomicrobiales bacterium]
MNHSIQMVTLHRKRAPLLRLFPALFLFLFGSHQLSAKIKFEENIRPVLERSCLKCHGGEKMKGEVGISRAHTVFLHNHYPLRKSLALQLSYKLLTCA